MNFDLKEYLIEKISEMVETKETRHIEPSYTTDVDLYNAVMKDVRKGLNDLFHAGMIEAGRTLNHKWIRIKNK